MSNIRTKIEALLKFLNDDYFMEFKGEDQEIYDNLISDLEKALSAPQEGKLYHLTQEELDAYTEWIMADQYIYNNGDVDAEDYEKWLKANLCPLPSPIEQGKVKAEAKWARSKLSNLPPQPEKGAEPLTFEKFVNFYNKEKGDLFLNFDEKANLIYKGYLIGFRPSPPTKL